MAPLSKVHPVQTIRHPQLVEMRKDWEVYLGLPFFTMSSITWCCWRCRGFALFALTQGQMSPAEGRPEVGGILLPAQTWHPALGQMGHLTTPYQPHWTRRTFLPSGMWVACCSNLYRNRSWCYEKTVLGWMLSYVRNGIFARQIYPAELMRQMYEQGRGCCCESKRWATRFYCQGMEMEAQSPKCPRRDW